MTAKHTPGPWAVESRGNLKARQFIEAGEFRIAECITLDQDANAHLIAAAPDLLASCVEFLPILERQLASVNPVGAAESSQAYQFAKARVERMRAAIAKAEGRN